MFHFLATLAAAVGLVSQGFSTQPSNLPFIPHQEEHASTTVRTEGMTDTRMGSSTPDTRKLRMVKGKIASISGTSFTLTVMKRGDEKPASTTPATIMVDASSARILKQTSEVSSTTASSAGTSFLAVGDMVGVLGTLSGSTLVAQIVVDPRMHSRIEQSTHAMATSTDEKGNGKVKNAMHLEAHQGNRPEHSNRPEHQDNSEHGSSTTTHN